MNNEPAFPNEGFNGWGDPFQGMTLRDYFAAKAMQGIQSRVNWSIEAIAELAYKQADEMLKERSK